MKKIITSTINILFLTSFISLFTFIHLSNVQAQEGVIYGKVLDKDKNVGIADVMIKVEKDGEKICNMWTDDKGKYRLPTLEKGDYRFSVYPPFGYEPFFEDKTVSIKESEEKEVNFILTPRYDYTISGKVFESDGRTPIEGAEITAYNVEGNIPDGFADSNKDGSYTLDGLKPGTYNLLCFSDEAAFPIKKDITLTKEKTSGINFIAYDNFISGVIKDEQGNSIKDAKVSVKYAPTEEDIKDSNIFFIKIMGPVHREVTTSDKGRYKISSLTLGNYSIEVYSVQLERKIKEDIVINQDTKRANLDFTLGVTEAVSSIYGKVTEEDGITPVANAYVITADSNKKLVGELIKTDNKGNFLIENLSIDTYALAVKKEGLATTIKKVKVEGGEEKNVKIIMEPSGSISGTVYYMDKKIPVKGARVFALKDDSTGVITTDEKGFYKIEDLKGGIYKVQAAFFDKKKVLIKGIKKNVKVEANKETSDIIIYLSENSK